MKQHSDNIAVTSGWAAILGVNAFTEHPLTLDGFRACLTKLNSVANTVTAEINNSGDTIPSVLLLSMPRFERIGSSRYKLNSPFFSFGGFIFRKGVIIDFDANGVCAPGSSSSKGTVLPAQFMETKYDTYNGEPLTSIKPSTLESLGIDQSILDVEEGFVMAKVLSIYVPDLDPVYPGETWAGYTLGSDPGASSCSIHDKYDRYAIQFTNKAQPFAYINVEEINTSQSISSDLNADVFDHDNASDFHISEYNTADIANIYRELTKEKP